MAQGFVAVRGVLGAGGADVCHCDDDGDAPADGGHSMHTYIAWR